MLTVVEHLLQLDRRKVHIRHKAIQEGKRRFAVIAPRVHEIRLCTLVIPYTERTANAVIEQVRRFRIFAKENFFATEQKIAHIHAKPRESSKVIENLRSRKQHAVRALANHHGTHARAVVHIPKIKRSHRRQKRMAKFKPLLARKHTASSPVQIQERLVVHIDLWTANQKFTTSSRRRRQPEPAARRNKETNRTASFQLIYSKTNGSSLNLIHLDKVYKAPKEIDYFFRLRRNIQKRNSRLSITAILFRNRTPRKIVFGNSLRKYLGHRDNANKCTTVFKRKPA